MNSYRNVDVVNTNYSLYSCGIYYDYRNIIDIWL